MCMSGYTRVHLCTFDAPMATMAAIEFELEIGKKVLTGAGIEGF